MQISSRRSDFKGFTLIEVMVVIAIIAILSAIAYPSYRDYVLRGRLVDATNGLAGMRADMERHFQDNRTFLTAGAFTTPCQRPVGTRTLGDFVLSCSALTANTYTLQAVGSGTSTGFTFTINETNVRATTSAPSDWGTCATGWMLKRGQRCS
jgi:prepilin-type N-terminal cleavage/methylation domain-containing protein